MSILSRLKKNIGVEEQDKLEEDEQEEEKPKTKKKIKIQTEKKSKTGMKKPKKTEKKKSSKPKDEGEIEDEEAEERDIEDFDDEDLDEELDKEAEKELEDLLDDEEYDEYEDEEDEDEEDDEDLSKEVLKAAKKDSKEKIKGFSLKHLAGPEGELAVDVYQTAKDIVIEAAIAGIEPDEMEVFIENDTVTIKGERGGCSKDQDKSYFYQECYWGAFQRRIILPEEVDATRAKAELKKGILCIRVPKTERKKRRKIDVKE